MPKQGSVIATNRRGYKPLIPKSGNFYSHKPPWEKVILKSGILYSHKTPWLLKILKFGIIIII
jgi:hypothetical protein